MNEASTSQTKGRAVKATTFQERVKARIDKAAQPGAVVIIPKCEGARVLLKIAEQVDDMLDRLYRESSMFGSISDTQKNSYEQVLIEHSVELSLLAEKLARKLPRTHKYYHPEALRRFIEAHPSKVIQPSVVRTAKKAKRAQESHDDAENDELTAGQVQVQETVSTKSAKMKTEQEILEN
jgi:hypothetical protein